MADVEFVDFARGPTHWRYANRVRPFVYQAQTYLPAPIKRGSIGQTQELDKSTLDITVPSNLPLLDLYVGGPPASRVTVRWWVLLAGESVARVLFTGAVASVEDSTRQSVIHCQNLIATMNATGLHRCWQKACPHVLYGSACKLSAQPVVGVVSAHAGTTLQAGAFAGKPDGTFVGGYVQWTLVDGEIERRFITGHTKDTITVLTPATLANGQAVTAYTGCAHDTIACASYGNILNYGGQPYIPTKNPFGGDPVF